MQKQIYLVGRQSCKVYMVQKYKDKIWYPVAYYSKKLTLLELNYNIYNKELLAIITVLKKWRAFL